MSMEVRDPVHGSIEIEDDEIKVIDSKYFQRLRNIKQLGFLELSFPGATHNRYIHSIGAMHLAGALIDSIFKKQNSEVFLTKKKSFRKIIRLAALLHDVGHGPLSHSSELAMPNLKDLRLPYSEHEKKDPNFLDSTEVEIKANHEDFTTKIIIDSGLTEILDLILEPLGASALHVASMINPLIEVDENFFIVDGINFRTLLNQLLSSELDCDRMDYLLRDAYYTGVSYGTFDIKWLFNNLSYYVIENKAHLCLEHRGLYSFDDFLLSRYHMFLMIYYHYKSVIFDEMLVRFLQDPTAGYRIPADVEEYVKYDDTHLYAFLRNSKNEWAKRIINVKPYKMVAEVHSGIVHPTDSSINTLREASKTLFQQGIDNILTTSTGKISKYFKKTESTGERIYVRYASHPGGQAHVPIEQATDIFSAYEKSRSITRLYIAKENEEKVKKLIKIYD